MENENAKITQGEVVSPQPIEEMDDDAFEAYIESAKEEEEPQETKSGDAEPAENEKKPYKSFATKEELQAYQDKTIGNRLKEIREAGERERKIFSEIYDFAKKRYAKDDGMEAINLLMAERKREDAMEDIKKSLSHERRVEEITRDWEQQAEALKNIVPDFDLEKAFENPDFYKSVTMEQKTLAEAYPTLLKRQERRAIKEVGSLTNGVMGSITHDIKSMSDKEFDDYIKKIKNL